MTLPAPSAESLASAPFAHSRLLRLGIKNPYFVGPMVGLTHVAFRELVNLYTPTGLEVYRYTEMLSTRKIPHESLVKTNELKTSPNESRLIPQILGNDEKLIAQSVEKLMSLNPFAIDINMGCPVSHTLRHNWGVRLMGDSAYAAQVVGFAKKNSSVPVSVKLRGSDSDTMSFQKLDDFTAALEDAGADWITIHPRTRSQGHKGKPQWELAAEIRNQRSIPVVVNGDIQTYEDILEISKKFELDGVMLGRAATARPWIFWQLAEATGDFRKPSNLFGGLLPYGAPMSLGEESLEFKKACFFLIDYMEQYFLDEIYILEKFRFFAATGSKWFLFGHAFWKLTTKAKTVAQLREFLEGFFDHSPHEMVQRVQFL